MFACLLCVCKLFIFLLIFSYIGGCCSPPGRKKTLRQGEYPKMETELYSWFLMQRERHATVTSHILREKAVQIYEKHYGDNKFTASRGWVNKFKKRYGIRHLKVSGEKLSSDPTVVLLLFLTHAYVCMYIYVFQLGRMIFLHYMPLLNELPEVFFFLCNWVDIN